MYAATAMDDPTPWLSVLMPVFDGAAYVDRAIESILREPTRGVEIVVADDGSTDGTPERIAARVGDRIALRLLRRPHDGNWVAGANLALRSARGRYACILHQDDLWLPGRLEAVREASRRRDAVVLVTHDARFIDSAGRDLGAWSCPLPPGEVSASALLERLLIQNFLAMPSPTFDREVALAAGGMDEGLWYTADWDLWVRVGAGQGCIHVPRPLAAFRVHPESQTVARRREVGELGRQMDRVLTRGLAAWRGQDPLRCRVERAARFSIRANEAIADAARGGPMPWSLLPGLLALGPGTALRYLRDSRIHERIAARVRARRSAPRA